MFGNIMLGIIIIYVVGEFLCAILKIDEDDNQSTDTKKPPNITQHNYDEWFKNDLMTDDDIHNKL